MFLISFKIYFKDTREENKYTGMAWKNDLIKTSLLAKFSGLRVQFESLFLILSNNSDHDSFLTIESANKDPK